MRLSATQFLKYSLLLLMVVASSYGTPVLANDNGTSVEGEFQFLSVDHADVMRRGIPPEGISVSSCILNIAAKANSDMSFLGVFELRNIGSVNSLPIFNISSRSRSDDGRIELNKISHASFTVAGINVDSSRWFHQSIRGNYTLIDPEVESGVEVFHHLTLGQRMRVQIEQASQPSSVTINISPMNAQQAMKARKCLKLLNNDI